MQSATIVGASTSTNLGFLQNAAISGTASLSGLNGFNQWNVSSDVAALSNQLLFHTAINYNFGGGAFTGDRGVLINLLQTGAAAGTSSAGGIEGIHVSTTTTNTFGGTNTGPGAAGAVTAANFYFRMASGSVNMLGGGGMEIDVEADTGATYQLATGCLVLSKASLVPGAALNNVAFRVGAQSGSQGFDAAFAVSSSWALTAAGSLFQADLLLIDRHSTSAKGLISAR